MTHCQRTSSDRRKGDDQIFSAGCVLGRIVSACAEHSRYIPLPENSRTRSPRNAVYDSINRELREAPDQPLSHLSLAAQMTS